ncbi:MAG: UDP-N-acetylmuramate--L-alanine ligase, partial [Chloroflexi bacterium]|nr:UDP-N-acetylmuramate--L-alanine ligase [Chloroflexota bacterium]
MKHIHFVGIGGAGLSAIAAVLLESGYVVSGSDAQPSDLTRRLARLGATIHEGHAGSHVEGADVVVASSAIPDDNAEVAAARHAGIPAQKRAEFLADFLTGRTVVAVAGTHGKTTTTGLVAFMLDRAGLKPSFIVGGVLADYATNAHSGASSIFVIEADEYDRMFLGLCPTVAVVTNVEHDHPDCYPTPESMQEAFRQFTEQIVDGGRLIVCADDSKARELGEIAENKGTRVTSYGLRNGAEWKAESIQPNGAGGNDFLVVRGAATLGLARIRLPGLHNVANSLAALAVADHFELDFNTAREALAEFRGVGRRFEIKGEARGITVIDD